MSEQTLRKVLWVDVIGSSATIAFTIFGAALLGGWLGVSAWAPLAVGLVLIPWVALLLRTVRRDQLRAVDVAAIVAGNLLWVGTTAVLLLGFPDALSTAGKWIVGIFAIAVLDLSLAEWMGLRGLPHKMEPSRV
ncbi:MAG: hypothetical protein U9N84_09810 [Actinomycetota bacterium]|nr:hypothetical protein [Actinomycetota bacterium]